MSVYLPLDWPAEVLPPGSEDFEASAVAWLLDIVPPDYRRHPVLRRHPAALAWMARYHAHACVEGARRRSPRCQESGCRHRWDHGPFEMTAVLILT